METARNIDNGPTVSYVCRIMVPWLTREGEHRRAWVLLAVLAGGIVSAGIDLFEDHAAKPIASGSLHSEAGGRASHLVRHQAEKTSPCSVCCFHKLLGQGLCPSSAAVSTADASIRPSVASAVVATRTELDAESNRGPPVLLSAAG